MNMNMLELAAEVAMYPIYNSCALCTEKTDLGAFQTQTVREPVE